MNRHARHHSLKHMQEMAKDMKKPTVYYDSSREILNKEKRIESHDVEIINNKTSLKNWIKKIIQN